MNIEDYFVHNSMFPRVQKQLIDDCQRLVDSFFYEASYYAIEKFVKTYTESLAHIEKAVIRHSGLMDEQSMFNQSPERIAEIYHQAQRAMLSELSRQQRHYATFLMATSTASSRKLLDQMKKEMVINAK